MVTHKYARAGPLRMRAGDSMGNVDSMGFRISSKGCALRRTENTGAGPAPGGKIPLG
jgi:hypothetical protein